MASTIKIKNSSTTGAVPSASDLVQGELAVNVTDTGLYTENASGTVVKLNAPSIDDKNTGATKYLTISTAGNLGLGVTPSAWGSGFTAFDLGQNSRISGNSSMGILNNAYYNGTNYIYKNTAAASLFNISNSGVYSWHYAASGTAGNAITFTQAMTLDASGNLGIGTTSPNRPLTVNGVLNLTDGSTDKALSFYSSTYGYVLQNTQAGPITLWTNGSERARIDSSGNLLVGQTDRQTRNSRSFDLDVTDGAMYCNHINGQASGNYYIGFGYNAVNIGSITQNGTTGVLYNLTSDYRLKNNPVSLTGAKDFVMALQPKTWDWWDGSGKGVGFIAHEFMEVAKYSGNGEKDAVDENGNPVYQSIQPSSSEVMANLVALLQEQQALITQLQADVAALKG